MARSRAYDPLQRFRFRVSIAPGDGQPMFFGFSRVSGLEKEYEVAEYAEGGYEGTHKLPGKLRTGVITCERGVASLSESATKPFELVEQFLNSARGLRSSIVIEELDYRGITQRTHVIEEAWVSKFTAPEYDAASSEVALESIEIQYEDFSTLRQL